MNKRFKLYALLHVAFYFCCKARGREGSLKNNKKLKEYETYMYWIYIKTQKQFFCNEDYYINALEKILSYALWLYLLSSFFPCPGYETKLYEELHQITVCYPSAKIELIYWIFYSKFDKDCKSIQKQKI